MVRSYTAVLFLLDVMRVVAAGLMAAGFFAPWVLGGGPVTDRTFSGFELARLAREVEAATSIGPLRGLALALYLVPVLGLNTLLVGFGSRFLGLPGTAWRLSALAGGLYVAFVAVTITRALRHSTIISYAVGRPEPGLFLVLGCSIGLALLAFLPSGGGE